MTRHQPTTLVLSFFPRNLFENEEILILRGGGPLCPLDPQMINDDALFLLYLQNDCKAKVHVVARIIRN